MAVLHRASQRVRLPTVSHGLREDLGSGQRDVTAGDQCKAAAAKPENPHPDARDDYPPAALLTPVFCPGSSDSSSCSGQYAFAEIVAN